MSNGGRQLKSLESRSDDCPLVDNSSEFHQNWISLFEAQARPLKKKPWAGIFLLSFLAGHQPMNHILVIIAKQLFFLYWFRATSVTPFWGIVCVRIFSPRPSKGENPFDETHQQQRNGVTNRRPFKLLLIERPLGKQAVDSVDSKRTKWKKTGENQTR